MNYLRSTRVEVPPTPGLNGRHAVAFLLAGIAAAVMAGCGHSATVAAGIQAAPTAGQPLPYTIVQAEPTATGKTQAVLFHCVAQLPPKPAHATTHRRYLHLIRQDSAAYLEDADGDQYHACRDRYGHLYPAAWDPATDEYAPLYYDGDRDCYYSVDDYGSYYYRSYVDDPEYANCYYQDNYDNYNDYAPPAYCQPVIYAPGYVYPYEGYYGPGSPGYSVTISFGGYGDYSYYQRRHEDWLWDLPVVFAAYLVLEPHHHHHGEAG
jgi:hypothetical protein